ncbi:hypothetical protein BY458DRAFT_409368, partial [Sporodiniella umbellata]
VDGDLLSSDNPLQISTLKIHFFNATLEKPGLYVIKEFYCHIMSRSLASLTLHLDLILKLLYFRNNCVSKSNIYDEHLINKK